MPCRRPLWQDQPPSQHVLGAVDARGKVGRSRRHQDACAGSGGDGLPGFHRRSRRRRAPAPPAPPRASCRCEGRGAAACAVRIAPIRAQATVEIGFEDPERIGIRQRIPSAAREGRCPSAHRACARRSGQPAPCRRHRRSHDRSRPCRKAVWTSVRWPVPGELKPPDGRLRTARAINAVMTHARQSHQFGQETRQETQAEDQQAAHADAAQHRP